MSFDIVEQIYGMGKQWPDKIAVEKNGQSYTYSQLIEIADTVSDAVHRGNVYGVMLDKGVELIGAIIGMMKQGAIFVPIDPDYPTERIMSMVHDAGISVLICDQKEGVGEQLAGIPILTFQEFLIHAKEIEASCNPDLEDCAYIYYTTGSTGKPKGVAGSRKALNHLIEWEINTFSVSMDARVSQLTSPSFGPFKRDIFVPLCVGGTVCIPEQEVILNPVALVNWLQKQNISLVHTVPSLFKRLLTAIHSPTAFHALHYIHLSGEPLEAHVVNSFYQNVTSDTRLVNIYGQTETTLAKFHYVIPRGTRHDGIIPVGTASPGTTAFILDESGNPVAHGDTGMLYLNTDHLTLGVVERGRLTTHRMITYRKNEFFPTGDMASQLMDGNFVIHGRIDKQVKIRGMRVDLNDVEYEILQCSGVEEAQVLLSTQNGSEGRMFAFLIGDGIEVEAVREHLKNRLPMYMRPSFIYKVDRFPLLPNGKLDRMALVRGVQTDMAQATFLKPVTPLQASIHQVWSTVLKYPNLSIDDDFFESGGDSLNAMEVVTKTGDMLGKRMPIRSIFEHPTIELYARYIESHEQSLQNIDKIEQSQYAETYPLSAAQKTIFIAAHQDPQSVTFNLPGLLIFREPIDLNRFKKAVHTITNRHEILRTTFVWENENPVQKINDFTPIEIGSFEVKDDKELDRKAYTLIKPFHLSQGPLWRIYHLKVNDTSKDVFFVDRHHIISDGHSLRVWIDELMKVYRGQSLEPLPFQYKDIAVHELNSTDNDSSKLSYWKSTLKDAPILNLPIDKKRPVIRTNIGRRKSFPFPPTLSEYIKKYAFKYNVTPFMVLFSMYNILLCKYSGQSEVVVGVPLAGRDMPSSEKLLGMFVNVLPIRSRIDETLPFEAILHNVKESVLNTMSNALPFDEIVRSVPHDHDPGRGVLFDSMFVLQPPNVEEEAVEYKRLDQGCSQTDLSFEVIEREHEYELIVEYSTDLFEDDTIARISSSYLGLFEQLMNGTGQLMVGTLSLLTEQELYDYDEKYNDTTKQFRQITIHTWFEEQANKTPHRTAIKMNGQSMTYEELNQKANQVAHCLQRAGIKKEDIVALHLHNSFELIISILGVLKAGGCYLPIDPYYPQDRIEYMLSDSGSRIVLMDNHKQFSLPGLICVDIPALLKKTYESCTNPNAGVNNSNLMYVIYTSGSTGKPKGVMIEHQGLVNYIDWRIKHHELSENDVFLQLISSSFDGFGINMFAPLLTGGTLVMIPQDKWRDFSYVKRVLEKESVTSMALVPSIYREILNNTFAEEIRSLRIITLGGEKLDDELIRLSKIKHPSLRIVNEYGPTENSIISTAYFNTDEGNTSIIGQPIQNVKAYIVDKLMNIVPIGVPGELVVEGPGLARGYIGREDLTKEKFISLPAFPNRRFYRTGDLAKRHDDGCIEFLGRMDDQIKIKGYRIELGEIENALLNINEVKEAAVVAKEINGEYKICSYFTSHQHLEDKEIRKELSNQIPFFMIPHYLIQLDSFPLTPVGKIDRKALPLPISISTAPGLHVQPETTTEKKLVEIWSKVLDQASIQVTDNFFELGGHSIQAIQMEIACEREGLPMKSIDLYIYSTIQSLAAHIDSQLTEVETC